jgi:peptide-methionine (R)-S-oxide reductase
MEKIKKSPDELKERLTPEQYHVTQEKGTERAFTGEYWNTKDAGMYRCVVCGNELFRSDTKFDSGTGWPSYFEPASADAVETATDNSHGMRRTSRVLQVRCASGPCFRRWTRTHRSALLHQFLLVEAGSGQIVRWRPLLGLAMVSALLTGCDLMTGDDPEDDLEKRRQAWQALGISDYTYDFVRTCFCGGPAARTLRIVVRANQIVSVTDVQTGSPPQFMPAGWAGTIDELFGELRREIDRDADKMELSFDPTFHFPARATIDRIRNAVDDEMAFTLSNFVAMR